MRTTISGLLVLLGSIIMGIGFFALIRGSLLNFKIATRKIAAFVFAAGFALFILAGAIAPVRQPIHDNEIRPTDKTADKTEPVTIPAPSSPPKSDPVSPTAQPTPQTEQPTYISYVGNLEKMPSNLLLGVKDSVKIETEGVLVSITLDGFEQTQVDNIGTRYFKTKFLVRNMGGRDIDFSPSKILMAAKGGGYRLSRGGAVYLDTKNEVRVKRNSEIKVTLNWHTSTYNTMKMNIAAQRVFITANAPISENITVNLQGNSAVFSLYFPEISRR